MEQGVNQPRTLHFQLLQYPSPPLLDRNIFPIRFLFLLHDEILSLYPDTVLNYDPRSGKRPRNRSPAMTIQDIGMEEHILISHNKTCTQHANPMTDPITKVFECFGLLELIFMYNTASEITAASAVNRRWYQAGRNDLVWKNACCHLWKDKCWMPVIRRGGSLAIYWRSLLTPEVIDRMSIKEIRCAFAERPMGQTAIQERLKTVLEKSEMKQALLDFMPDHLGSDCDHGRVWNQPFRFLWFGSYVSSVLDSTRSTITIDELCCPKGFDMHFKVIYEEHELGRMVQQDDDDDDEEHSSGRIKLHFHSTCYFSDVNNEFRMDNREDMMHQVDLNWRWIRMGRAVQVGPYPPLLVSRRENWGWQLENAHVVLLSHE